MSVENSDSATFNKLKGEQVALLCKALEAAIPEEETLAEIVLFSLYERLSNIPKAKTYRALIFNLVNWAESRGKIRELIIAASLENPRSILLQRFVKSCIQVILCLSPLPLPNDNLLTSLIQELTGIRDFTGIVLSACSQTLPDLENSFPELRGHLFNNEICDEVKWLILLELFLITWEHNDKKILYIILFVQNLALLATDTTKVNLIQWLSNLPESIRPESQVQEQKIYQETPSNEALEKIQAYFLLTVEPVETSDSDKYGINGYVVTRLGIEDSYTKIESISLQIILSKESNDSSKNDPYYTLEQIKNEFPEWLVQVTEWIGIRCRKLEKDYNLDFILSPLLKVEFWLPIEHLSAATEDWEIYGLPSRLKQRTRILGKEHSVLVRCYDRFSEQESLDKLNRNWQVLVSHSQKPVDVSSSLVNSFHLDCWSDRKELKSQFNQPCLSLSLTCPICSQDYKRQREDLFTWMLDKGIPIVLWSRSVDLTDDQKTPLKQKMKELLAADIINQLEQILEEVKKARADTNDTDKLALWCDEPKRLMELKKFREKGRLHA
jgi:vWA-MoxR associated protein C-terminal domain/Effector-associated domain 1